MILREFITIAAGNLWRLKLRTALTISGVMIGIGALTTLLSYAVGVQHNVAAQFREIGLLHTLHIMPPGEEDREDGRGGPHGQANGDHAGDAGADSTASGGSTADSSASPAAGAESTDATSPGEVVLDDRMLTHVEAIEGVTFVYPQDTFDARLTWRDQERTITAQVLPAEFVARRNLGQMLAGRFFDSDSVAEVVLSRRLVERLEADPDSILGDTLRLKVAGRAQLGREFLKANLRQMNLPEAAVDLAERFADAFAQWMGPSELALRVCGVAEIEWGFGFRLHDVLLPPGPAEGVDRFGFGDPIELLSRLQSPGAEGYPLAVATLDPRADRQAVTDSVEALGLRPISFLPRLEEIRRFFLIFDLVVGLIGMIALLVASLGIVNTMVMSITERTREIGILKSLGAEERQVRGLFLVEAGLIGLIGSSLGLLVGWGASRLLSFIAKRVMISQGVPEMEFFRMPVYLALGAIAFGVAISLLAGVYPASRAARTDPVQALRHD